MLGLGRFRERNERGVHPRPAEKATDHEYEVTDGRYGEEGAGSADGATTTPGRVEEDRPPRGMRLHKGESLAESSRDWDIPSLAASCKPFPGEFSKPKHPAVR